MIDSLDNPVWGALSSRQAHFNIGGEKLKYFPGDVAPFVGLRNWDEGDLRELTENLPADRKFSILLPMPVQLPEGFEIIFSTPLYQMICPSPVPYSGKEIEVRDLTIADVPAMLELTALTKPGPFYERTIEFGNYRGIFFDDKLASMAGDRMRLEGFTEVSAICTNPAHLGKGLASYMISKASERIFGEGDIPFLHVRQDNIRAIEVYKKLGFEVRVEICFVIFGNRAKRS